MRVRGSWLAGCVLATLIGSGCASRTVVTRVDPGEQIDLSGQWNDSDSRLVSDEMIADCLKQPWRERFGKSPTIIAGSIRNLSLEHIPVGTFVKDIERALVNSGDAQVVASAAERGELRDEKADQRINASPETLKEMGREVGADFMLIGEINQIVDKEKGDEVRFYQVDLSLVNIETNVKAWIGQKKIKKFVSSKKYKP
ncbi:MAG: penicillin-binding protein activator LpoB [Candidatus Eisenbacteria bacterium]